MAENKKFPIIIISGATATGKSKLAHEIAKKYQATILNADSLQIFGELPILTAQPSPEERNQVEYLLYGIFDAKQKISVGIWLNLIVDAIEKLYAKNILPIIVGGTGMYLSTLVNGIANIPEIYPEFKNIAIDLYEKIGHQEFVKKFGNEKIIDKQKLLRRAEVFLQEGREIEYFYNLPKKILFDEKIAKNFNFMHFNLNLEREINYKNCDNRFLQMIENNVLKEVEDYLKSAVFFEESSVNKSLGFQEIRDFIDKKIDKNTMIKIATQKTRNYAKRQITWFKHQFENIIYCDNSQNLMQKIITNI
ncbi:MAG: tRNA (adenosine(37)-N6)-dimethylallyltransferase MiaA [Alphaproteobacteria bacterium]